jgi:hypothetical protein
MRLERNDPPREFEVGEVTLRHSADVELEPDEQITLVTGSGTEYDLVRKSWGYYATPSMNGRLAAHGLRAALAVNPEGKLNLLLVERGHEPELDAYLADQRMRVVSWLDSDEAVASALERLDRP